MIENNDTKRSPSPDWVSRLEAARTADQIFIAAGTGDSTASVSMHEKAADGRATKIIIPSELQNMAGFVTSAVELAKGVPTSDASTEQNRWKAGDLRSDGKPVVHIPDRR